MTSQLEDESSKPSPPADVVPVSQTPGSLYEAPSNRRLIAIIAAIGAMAAIALFLHQTGSFKWTSSTGGYFPPVRTPEMTGPAIGQIQSVEGQVEIRPPRGTYFVTATVQPLVAEAVIQTQAASAAVIEFQSGPTIRLLANSRLVAELDPTRENTVHATLLSGEFAVLNPGTSESFTISHNGVVIDYKTDASTRKVPLIPVTDEAVSNETPQVGELAQQENSAAEITEKLEAEKESELATMPATEVPTLGTKTSDAPATDATAAAKKDVRESTAAESNLLRSTLTNDDIRTQMKAQAGGLQKCYVSMVNRMSESSLSGQTDSQSPSSMSQANEGTGELPRGEVVVSFKILASGKVEGGQVVRSPFEDELFGRCVVEALNRVRFRPFQGATIPVAEFPIVLE